MASSSKETEKDLKKIDLEDVEKNRVIVTEEELQDDNRSDRIVRKPRRTRVISAFFRHLDSASVGRKRAWWARGLVLLASLTVVLGLAFIIWIGMVLALIHHLTPAVPHNGLNTILMKWREPMPGNETQLAWLPNFSTGVTPKPIHSHNDYDRDIPLFHALSVGCTGVEADIWLEKGDLQVGHTQRALRPGRTLQSLYLNPLQTILSSQNTQNPSFNSTGSPLVGVFNQKPRESLILLLDFKSDPTLSFPLVMTQLAPLREAGYLTHWDGSHIVNAPMTIVLSGLASKRLDFVQASNGTVFLDAPLLDLSQPDSPYNTSNSLYSSAPLAKAIDGYVPFSGFNAGQKKRIEALVNNANAKGLKSRFWATPAWPVGLRDRTWKQLVRRNVGMLNVDDIVVAARWNWDWCVVAGMRLC